MATVLTPCRFDRAWLSMDLWYAREPFPQCPWRRENIGTSCCGWHSRSFYCEKLNGSCEQDAPHPNVGYLQYHMNHIPIFWLLDAIRSYLPLIRDPFPNRPSHGILDKLIDVRKPFLAQVDDHVQVRRTLWSPKDVYLVSQGLIDGFNGATPCYTWRYSQLYKLYIALYCL